MYLKSAMFWEMTNICIRAIWTIFSDKHALLITTKNSSPKMQYLARTLVCIDFLYIYLGLAIDTACVCMCVCVRGGGGEQERGWGGVLYTMIF